MKKIKRISQNLFLTLLSFVLLSSCNQPEPAKNIALSPLFTNNMVLQQKQDIAIWGTAEAGGEVNVSLNGQQAKTIVADNGLWNVKLKPIVAGGPYELVISGEDTIKINNVMMGEVWICSGQSNMEMPMLGKWSKVNNYEQEIAGADYPNIRLLMVDKEFANTPQTSFNSKGWKECSPETIAKFSAVAYFFGRNLHKKLNVPIGLVQTAWGGTIVEAWTSAQSLKKIPEFTETVNEIESDTISKEEWEAAQAGRKKEWPDKIGKIIKENGSWEHGYQNSDNNIADWKTMKLPTRWEDVDAGMEEVDGLVWFSRDVEVPASWKGKELMLSLGKINDYDFTWFNGVKVGRGIDVSDLRYYAIPANLVKPGKNRITVEVLDIGASGGLYGPATEMKLSNGNDSIILTGNWKYKVEPIKIDVSKLPEKPDQNSGVNRPTVLYNAMINPLLKYRIRGAIWYQGESNAERAYQYRTLFKTMINDWRTVWKQGDFPFFFVQLANFKAVKEQPAGDSWAELREAQTMALDLPNTGMAVTIDIGDAKDIHPGNKQDVGKRLALTALSQVYGNGGRIMGPMYKSMKIEGNKIRLQFDYANEGLKTRNSEKLTGFAVAGKDSVFVWADAEIIGNEVIVSSTKVDNPVAVRYGWAANPICNLYNGNGLPASPFRTDDWEGVTYGKK